MVDDGFVHLRLSIGRDSYLGPLLPKVASFKIATVCKRIPVGRSEASLAGSAGTGKEETWKKRHMVSWCLCEHG